MAGWCRPGQRCDLDAGPPVVARRDERPAVFVHRPRELLSLETLPPCDGFDSRVLMADEQIDDYAHRCLQRAHGNDLFPGIRSGESKVSPRRLKYASARARAE